MKYLENLIIWMKSNAYRLRTVVPGVVDAVATSNPREQNIDVQSATPDLVAGEAAPTDITPDTPMLNFTSGGFFVLMPVATGDEVLGLVADRATGDWITTRTPGQVDEVNGERAHVLSDMLAVPFAISAPSGAPVNWDKLTIGGPAGVAIELEDTGPLTITKRGVAVATVTMDAAGSVSIQSAAGQKILLGTVTKPTINSDVLQALDAFANAVPVPNDGGAALHTAFKTAYLLVRPTLETVTVEVE